MLVNASNPSLPDPRPSSLPRPTEVLLHLLDTVAAPGAVRPLTRSIRSAGARRTAADAALFNALDETSWRRLPTRGMLLFAHRSSSQPRALLNAVLSQEAPTYWGTLSGFTSLEVIKPDLDRSRAVLTTGRQPVFRIQTNVPGAELCIRGLDEFLAVDVQSQRVPHTVGAYAVGRLRINDPLTFATIENFCFSITIFHDVVLAGVRNLK